MNRNSKLLHFFRRHPATARTIANFCIFFMIASSIAVWYNWIPEGIFMGLEFMLFVTCGMYAVLWFEYGVKKMTGGNVKNKRKRKKKNISGSGRNTLEQKLEAVPDGYESHAAEHQLWFTLYNKEKGDLTIRFKGPDTIGDIIEQLVYYRKKIWPDAPELDFDKDFSQE